MASVVRAGTVAAPTHSTPLKPILSKKSGSILGTRARDSDDDPGSEQRPSKRQKSVVFDESLNTVKQIGNKSLQEVKIQVKKALEGHNQGDDTYYDELKDVFASDRRRRRSEDDDDDDDDDDDVVKPQELLLYILALTSYTPLLGRGSGLIKNVLDCQWLARDDAFAKAYVQFLASFVSAQGACMSQVLSMIVDNFLETRRGPRTLPGYGPVKVAEVKERLHLALRYLCKLFPTCEPVLFRQLENKFPSSDESTEIHMGYIEHLLKVREYTDLGRDILQLITTKCCELDIEMQLDLEDDTDDTVRDILQDLKAAQARSEAREADGEEPEQLNEEDDDDDASDLESVLSDESDMAELKRIAKIKNKIQSMDTILDALFTLYSQELADPDSDKAADFFEDILADFVNVILVRYKSRSCQFLVFWAAQRSSYFSSRFIGCLLDIITGDETRTALVKQSAVSYLAGFVARAARVSTDDVRMAVGCLLGYTEHFRYKHESNSSGPDITRYPVYYALFQGLLYIFCFRWRDLIVDGTGIDKDDIVSYFSSDLTWIENLEQRLKSSIHSKLNPLKVCAPVIVQEFAKLAHALNLIYVYPRIEMNKSVTMSTINAYSTGALREISGKSLEERWAPLQAEFPFDPYQLPVSRRWLEKEELYITWQSIQGKEDRSARDHSDTEDDSDVENEEEVEDEDAESPEDD